MKKLQTIANVFLQILFSVMFLAGVAITFWAAYLLTFQDVPFERAGALLLFGIVFMVLSKWNSLEEFTLGPIKAKLRQAIQEANATVDEVRTLAKAISKATLTDLIAGSFMGSMSFSQRYEIFKEVMRALTDIGLNEAERKHVSEEWRKGVSILYSGKIRDMIIGVEQSHVKDWTKHKARNGLLESELQQEAGFATWKSPSPEDFEAFMKKHSFPIDTELKELLTQYKTFLATGEIPDKNLFDR